MKLRKSFKYRLRPNRKQAERFAQSDVGFENFATIASDRGVEEAANPRFLRRDLSHLRFLSRQLSKKQKGSRNWKRAKNRLSFFHAKVHARRIDFLHKLSARLVKSLKVQSLLSKAPRPLARAISDAGWGPFLCFLNDKCEHSCKRFVEAGVWFPNEKVPQIWPFTRDGAE